jgi:hypothetical protein
MSKEPAIYADTSREIATYLREEAEQHATSVCATDSAVQCHASTLRRWANFIDAQFGNNQTGNSQIGARMPSGEVVTNVYEAYEAGKRAAHQEADSVAIPAYATARQRYDELRVEDEVQDPLERLRAFCSLAMNGQDWLDVEQFFDALDGRNGIAIPAAEPVIDASGTFECPICGDDTTHDHTSEEVSKHRAKQKQLADAQRTDAEGLTIPAPTKEILEMCGWNCMTRREEVARNRYFAVVEYALTARPASSAQPVMTLTHAQRIAIETAMAWLPIGNSARDEIRSFLEAAQGEKK